MYSCSEPNKTLFSLIPSNKSGVHFNNRIIETDSFNIITNEYIFNGGGVAIGDFNNDGLADIFFSGNQVPNKLYLNQGNFEFKDISEEAGIGAENSWSTGIAVVDINNDNLLDIYICTAMLPTEQQKRNLLFVNLGLNEAGIPVFEEMAEKFGIADSGNSMGATFFDYNKDGFLDLYILNNVDIHVLPANYRTKITDGSALSNDKLYRNNGDGTFSDVTLEAGITIEGYGLGLAISDLNYDGWPDIYVSNDYLTNDILYINNQDGTFSNQIEEYIKHQSKFSMGCDISDYDNDGFLDIITLDMLGETNERIKTTIANNKYTTYILNDKFDYEYQYSRNMLQKGNGNGVPFSEMGLMAGVSRTDWSWSPLFVDMDNDGYKDLLITNGFPRDITDLDFGEFKFNVSRYLAPGKILDSIPTIKIPNYGFKYNGDSRFIDVSNDWGLNTPSFSNGAAFADLDNDGDLDYIVNNINDEAFIFKNNLENFDKENSNYLIIKLKSDSSTTPTIGTKVVIRYEDDKFQYHEHYLNRGYMSSVQDLAHFGLKDVSKVQKVEVLWPDGKFQELFNLNTNQIISIEHKNAKNITNDRLNFPLVPKANIQKEFTEVSKDVLVNYMHKEADFIDFNVQRILPHKLTQNGPCLASGDLNGDGYEDFIVGSSTGYAPQLFFQKEDGTFLNMPLFSSTEEMKYEEESMVLFDLDNDGDLDLYLVSGSNEFAPESEFYVDRLMINDGKGNFQQAKDRMPVIKSSGSVVSPYDFDGDGYVDLFVGGRTPFAQYPVPEKSFLLRNDQGILKDVTDNMAPKLRNIGMVTDATWHDIDSDGIKDLVIVGEFMPITFFKNEKSKLRKLENTGIDSLIGWWESIQGVDFDNDGDIDFVVGNMGANNFYQPSKERPISLIAKDFDNNGTIDPVMFAYFRTNFDSQKFESFPVNFWGDLYGQSPIFRKKFNSFKAYSKSTQSTLFSQEELAGSQHFVGNYDRSICLENLGDGTFAFRQLPWEVQIAPINGILALDFDEDNHMDVLLIGNDFGNEISIGRYDAFNGAVLKGNGKGDFEVVPPEQSGFMVDGDAKHIIYLKNAIGKNPYIIVTQNRGSLKIFQKN